MRRHRLPDPARSKQLSSLRKLSVLFPHLKDALGDRLLAAKEADSLLASITTEEIERRQQTLTSEVEQALAKLRSPDAPVMSDDQEELILAFLRLQPNDAIELEVEKTLMTQRRYTELLTLLRLQVYWFESASTRVIAPGTPATPDQRCLLMALTGKSVDVRLSRTRASQLIRDLCAPTAVTSEAA